MSETVRVGAAHPSLPGHFPGMPVVPGVVVLTEILHELARQRPELTVRGVRKLKFLSLLLPEQSFKVEFAQPAAGALRFKCVRDGGGEPLVDGHLLLQPSDSAGSPSAR